MLAQMIIGANDPAQTPAPGVSADDKRAQEADSTSADAQQSGQVAAQPFPLFNQFPPPPVDPAGATQLLTESIAIDATTAAAIDALTELRSSRTGAAADSQASPSGSATPDAAQFSALVAPKIEQPAVTAQVHAPVGSQHWPEELGAQLTMIAHRGEHVAALKLSPEHLGPLEVRITTQDDRTTVWFGAAHAETRAALEQALPRLRELFAAQGMHLTDAGVHREPPRDNSRAFAQSPGDTASSDSALVGATTVMRVGLLDAYA